MSALLFMRFLAQPLRIAYILPSSKVLVRKVAAKIDFTRPSTIVEFGPGEGCHTRELVRQMHPESRLLLFELDPQLAAHLREQFDGDQRVEVLNIDAIHINRELRKRGIDHCDYVVSGIPFSCVEVNKKRSIVRAVFEALAPNPTAAFIIYQVTNELKQHAQMFPRTESEYFVPNVPPMILTVYYKQEKPEKQAALNGNGHGAGHKNGAAPRKAHASSRQAFT